MLVWYCFKKSTAAQSCSHGTLQLVGGQSSNEGRVEICINGVWGTVCHSSWSSNDAQVVCRQLGFSGSGTSFATSKCSFPPINSIILNFLGATALYGYQHTFGRGTGPVFLYSVGCSGTESSLLSCSHRGISYNWCSHSADAGVVCPCRLDVYSCLLNIQGINNYICDFGCVYLNN